MHPSLDLVVFDLAGTTVDDGDAVNRALRAALAAAGVIVTRESVNAVMGLPKPEAISVLIEGNTPTKTVLQMHADFVAAMVELYATDPAIGEVPGTSETFRALRAAGIKIGVDTGFSRDITQTILNRLGWLSEGLIDASVASDEVERGRPHPDMIQHLMRVLGVSSAERVAKVGDTPADLWEGHNAGCGMVIGVTQGTHTHEQLEPLPHTHLVRTVVELPALLGLV